MSSSSWSWSGYVYSWFQFDPLNIPSYTVPLLSSTSPSYEEYDDDESNDDEDDDSRPPINKKGSHLVQTQAQARGKVRTKFGQSVLWLERSHGGYHITANELEKYRTIGDRPIDRIVQLLRDEKRHGDGNGAGNGLGPGDDLLEMMKQATEKIKRIKKKKKQPQHQQQQHNMIDYDESTISTADLAMASFYHSVSTLPPWVDIEQLRRGQEVYLAYLPAISMSLYYRSLIAGFSIPKIAAVIRATAYLAPPSRPDQVMQRLLDTGEFTACIGGGLGVEALLPGGIGWKTALHVRFLHAKVRFAILNKNQNNKKQSSQSWNVEELGVPINQEDMAATLLAFSTNVLMGVSLLAGRAVSDHEQRDYLALWRYVGWLLGVETDHTVGVIVESFISPSTSSTEPELESDNDDGGAGDNSNGNNNNNSNSNSITDIESSTSTASATTTESETESGNDDGDCDTDDTSTDHNHRNSNNNSIGNNNDTNNSNGNIVQMTYRHLHSLTVQEDLFELPPPLDPCGPGNANFVQRPDVIDNSSGMFSSMIFHLLEPDDSSQEVAHHLLKACVRTSPFYFRAMNCRRMIGNDLADALGLPYHPHRFTRARIWLFSTIELLLVRLYTLIPMYFPCFVRRRMVQWHTQALHAFHEQWRKTHHSKMARAMQRKELPSVLDNDHNDDNNNKKQKKNVDATIEDVTDTATDATATHSVCPFAMMTKPK